MSAQNKVTGAQLAANLTAIFQGRQDLILSPAAVKAAHSQYMREYAHQRYHTDEMFRAAAIRKASARVQQCRLDPAYRAREAELQRARRQRRRDARALTARA